LGAEPEVVTTAGVVRGQSEGAIAVFRGIPYAQPPVGPLRFRAPVPVHRWDGVRDARHFGPPAPQATHTGSVMSSVSGSVADGSVDCLTLNVWSPDIGASRLPVMVWIHGSRYLEGTAANPHYDGAAFAAAGVVVGSMNYRVGAEGFAHIDGVPDNRGILDQLAALRWVQHNIAAFGGDPGNVTVFGQSAGAGCIASQLVMPLAAGLFHRAIAQSLPGTYFSARMAAAISGTIAAELGLRATVNELSRIPPRALVDATEAVARKLYPTWLPGRAVGSHPKSTVSPSNNSRNPPETSMVSPGPAFGTSSLQRSLKWAKHPPGVSAESMTPQP
jgi:para-nitrobenzyl esterase